MINKYTKFVLFYFLLLLVGFLVIKVAYAGDYHQSDQSHRVVYVITDNNGNPVTGQTVRIAVQRVSDDAFLDFNDNIFKTSGWTTRLGTMNYNVAGEYYQRQISIDQATRVSNDYVCIISNDDATYGDQQVEVVHFDNLKNLIKINR